MYTLWSHGALQKRKRLMSGGVERGLLLEDSQVVTHETVEGAALSALVPSPSGQQAFIFEWDEHHNVKYVLQLQKLRRKRRR